eukprot:362602-Chlamydomonas_euryale.AAC.4
MHPQLDEIAVVFAFNYYALLSAGTERLKVGAVSTGVKGGEGRGREGREKAWRVDAGRKVSYVAPMLLDHPDASCLPGMRLACPAC